MGRQNAVSVHVTLVPAVSGGELKTKPTQHAVKELQEVGIQPDALVIRAAEPIDEGMRRKIASFTNVEFEGVISGHDAKTTIYEFPLLYHAQGFDTFLLKKMGIESRHADLREWKEVVRKYREPKRRVRIGVVGKYMELTDSYKSVWEALSHGGIANEAAVDAIKIDSGRLEAEDADMAQVFAGIDGILVPGGYGQRGSAGMVKAANWARENKVALFRHLPGDADDGDRVGARRAQVGGRRLDRVQPGQPARRHQPSRGADRREELRRHAAPGQERERSSRRAR